MNPQHNAFAAAREFSRSVQGDCRILRRELQNDPESRVALQEVARFLGQLSQEMASGAAQSEQQQPEQPARSLAELGQQPQQPAAAPQAAAPEDESDVAQLLASMRK